MTPSKLERGAAHGRWLGLATLVGAGVLLALPALRTSAQPAPRVADATFRPTRVLGVQPAIVNPPTLPAREVRDEVVDNELVLGVVVAGQARAYPINMLTGPRREIINDTLGGRAIAATW